MEYGREHIIPTPFSKEVLVWVASAVAKAAFDDGVTDMKKCELKKYQDKLRKMIYVDSDENPSLTKN
ncbi:MAG: hypothetical protein KAU90_11890, partial [Sulfurovaceae bacterium]|nr:hypothetical protein [Sulfurovaceae bacterium]